MLTCRHCSQTLPLLNFYLKGKDRRGGKQPYNNECKDCCYKRKLEYHKTEVGKKATRASKLRKRFGISIPQYETLLAQQKDTCAICGGIETKIHKVTGEVCRLVVDHDHSSGMVRGLLCSACNLGLGNFKDSIINLLGAIKYLEEHNNEIGSRRSNVA